MSIRDYCLNFPDKCALKDISSCNDLDLELTLNCLEENVDLNDIKRLEFFFEGVFVFLSTKQTPCRSNSLKTANFVSSVCCSSVENHVPVSFK